MGRRGKRTIWKSEDLPEHCTLSQRKLATPAVKKGNPGSIGIWFRCAQSLPATFGSKRYLQQTVEKNMHHTAAIVLAMFGTSVEKALDGFLSLKQAVRNAYPHTPVRLAFTSTQIRQTWRQRATDASYLAKHPEIPEEILHIQDPLAVLANLQDSGCKQIVVQPIHIAAAEEFHDLLACVRALSGIRSMKPAWRPFTRIALGRPLLGSYSLEHPYSRDIQDVAEALHDDAVLAQEQQAALVYMGHGNQFFPTGGFYLELAAAMRRNYPETPIFIGALEGYPDLPDVLFQLKQQAVTRLLLKPFLVAAGGHAVKDMTGSENSWQKRLEREGFEVLPVIKGLIEHPLILQLFLTHLADAANDASITLE